jgi:hypothetical protein
VNFTKRSRPARQPIGCEGNFSQAARTATFREPRSSIFVIRRLDLEQTPTKIIHTAAWKKADGPDHENIPTCA